MKTTRRRFLQGAAALAAALGITPPVTASPVHVPFPVEPTDCVTTPSWPMSGSCSVSVSPSASPSHGPDEYMDADGYWRHLDEDE
jgi:hypothetical protein